MAAHLECDPSGRRRAEDLKKTSGTVSMFPGVRCDKLRIGVPYISQGEMYWAPHTLRLDRSNPVERLTEMPPDAGFFLAAQWSVDGVAGGGDEFFVCDCDNDAFR